MTQEANEKCDGAVAYFHLPGLFEFYGLYSCFCLYSIITGSIFTIGAR